MPLVWWGSRCRRCTAGVQQGAPFCKTPAAHCPHTPQGEDAWRATDMRLAVDTWRACFLDALQADVRAGMAEKARAAAAQPTLAW